MSNPSFNFEELRSTFNKSPWLAKVTSPILQMVYAQSDTFCLTDRQGNIFTYEEFKKLVDEMEKFYRIFSDQDITDSNINRSKSHHYSRKSKSPTKRKMVYLMKANGNYKIGVSLNPKERLKQLKIGLSSINLIHSFNADDALQAEETLHHIFKKKNVGGEWFSLSGEDIADIQSVTEYKDGEFIKETQ